MNKNRNGRIYGLDLFRVLCVLMVFLFHSQIHIDSDFGILNSVIGLGAIYMSAFFILSGYVLSLVYNKLDLNMGGEFPSTKNVS